MVVHVIVVPVGVSIRKETRNAMQRKTLPSCPVIQYEGVVLSPAVLELLE